MEKRGLYQIGDVAKMFHISVGTLRHYEKAGLLQPEYTDIETGYRYYSTRQFECLNTIRYLRVLDMPLEQIADFLNNRVIFHGNDENVGDYHILDLGILFDCNYKVSRRQLSSQELSNGLK